MITTSQIKRIHTLKALIGLDNDLYKDILMSFGVQSSKNLTYTEADILLEILEEKAIKQKLWFKPLKKYENLNRSNNMATQSQLRMIEGMWREICYFDNDDFAKTSLRKFLQHKFHVDDILFLTKSAARKVIQGILNIKKNVKGAATPL